MNWVASIAWVADLKTRGLTSKVRKLSSGAIRGGVPFTQGPLFYMLRNRFYIGEVTFKGEVLPGPQPPLLERSLFEAVQAKLTEQWSHRTRTRQKSKALLSGLLFDDAGNRMIPTHATRNRVRYRYYISQPRQRGHSDGPVGSISRVRADQIEALVTNAVRDQLMKSGEWLQSPSEQNAIAAHIAKVEVRAKHLAVTIKAIEPTPDHDRELAPYDDAGAVLDQAELILIPWTKPPMRKFRDVIQPASASTQRTRTIRAGRRAGLIRAIVRGRQWLDEIVSGRSTIEEIAVRQKCSVRQINLTLSMAFLAPPLVRATIEGRLPRGIGIAELRDAPPAWSKQYMKLGLPAL